MNDTNLTYHLPLLFDELVKNGAREKWSEKKENNNRRELQRKWNHEWQANRLTNANALHSWF